MRQIVTSTTIKLHNRQVFSRKFLCRLIVCGAAAICANYQCYCAVLVLGPYLEWENVSAFLRQGKNDANFKADPVLTCRASSAPYYINGGSFRCSNPLLTSQPYETTQ